MIRVNGGNDSSWLLGQIGCKAPPHPGLKPRVGWEDIKYRSLRGAYCRTTNVTRRFIARPSGLALSAIGAVLP